MAIPGSAVFLENVLLKTANEEEADELLAVISSEYAQACLDDLQLEVDRERVRRSPKRVLALIGLANCLSHRWLDVSALRKAKEVVEVRCKMYLNRTFSSDTHCRRKRGLPCG